MSLLQALVLGLVQGLTEFLPISSSGHLTLVPFLFGWEPPSVSFDVAVHVGTLVSVVWVLRDRVSVLWRALRSWRDAPPEERHTIRMLAIGTVPAVIVGGALGGPVESVFQRPVLVSLFLGVTGYLLISTESRVDERAAEAKAAAEAQAAGAGEPAPAAPNPGPRRVEQRDAIAIGVAQAVAILPGISRSGATIAAGMRRGLPRVEAARFSFLLAIPVIVGAAIAKLPDLVGEGIESGFAAIVVGVVASALSGAYAVRWLLGLFARRSLRAFGTYCFLAMVAGLLTALARG